MPPKEQKTDPNIAYVLNVVKGYWPEFQISSQMLENPTSEFVTRYFTEFLAEVNDQVAFLLNKEVNENMEVNKDFDSEVQLFRKLAPIFKKMKFDTFCLNDIYNPVPKRTRCYIKSTIHFLIFIHNHMEDWEKLTNNVFARVEEMNNMEVEMQEVFEEIGELTEEIAKSEDKCQAMLLEKAALTQEYEKMLEAKHIKDKIHVEKQAKIENLIKECENEEYQLKALEEEEANLKKQLITEHDFEVLKNMELALKGELERLSMNDDFFEEGLDEQKKNVSFIESCIEKLEKLNFDTLSEKVQKLREVDELEKKNSIENKKLGEEVETLRSAINNLKSEIDVLNERVTGKEKELKELKEKSEKEIAALKEMQNEQRKKTFNKIKTAEELKNTLKIVKDEMKLLENEKEIFKEAFTVQYKRILEHQNMVIKNTFDVLSSIK